MPWAQFCFVQPVGWLTKRRFPEGKALIQCSGDKKNEGGVVTLVLLKKLGEAYLDRSLSEATLTAFLAAKIAP